MNPNKKAEELIEKFGDLAVNVVDEIIRELTEISTYKDVNDNMPIEYWQQVKELIINKK